MIEALLVLVSLAALTWFVADSLKARETGIAAAREICFEEGLQFLDDSVVQQALRLTRKDSGHVAIQRTYGFEYSDTGNNRRAGYVTLLGTEVMITYTGPRQVATPTVEQNQIG